MMRIRRIRWPGVRRRLAGLRRCSGTGRVPPALRGIGTWPPRMGPGNSPLLGIGPVHREPPQPAYRRRPGSPAASMAKSTGWARLRKIDGWQGRLACRSFRRSAGTSHPTDFVTASFSRSEPGLASPSLITSRARAPTLSVGNLQDVEGTHEPWNPNGTRTGRCTVATGGPENDVASRITRSLASRVAS